MNEPKVPEGKVEFPCRIEDRRPILDRNRKVLKGSFGNEIKKKAWMRNRKCVCGSGKKFKKCCWGKYQ
jgi:uncharacterized protein YecA (UPF0149 family)